MKNINIFLLIILLGFIWTVFVEPYILTVKTIQIKSEQLKGTKIVFASDFHIKPYEKFRLEKIVKKINAQNPDLVLLGGDFVNGHKKGFTLPIENIADELQNIHSNYGVITVLGNHDNWQGKDEIIKALTNAKITILQNENIKINDKFFVAGLEDIQTQNPDINMALKNTSNPTILLTHSPDTFPDVPENVFLTLAGHTHGGQVVLFRPILVPSIYGKKYAYGLNRENGKTLYTTRGLGSSILPVRFNCRPEIVVIEFM